MKFFCRDRNCWGAHVWCAGHQIPVGADGILETDIQDSCLQFLKNPSVYVDLSTPPRVKPRRTRGAQAPTVAPPEELRKELIIEPIQLPAESETLSMVEPPKVEEQSVSIQMEPEQGFKKPAKRGKR